MKKIGSVNLLYDVQEACMHFFIAFAKGCIQSRVVGVGRLLDLVQVLYGDARRRTNPSVSVF